MILDTAIFGALLLLPLQFAPAASPTPLGILSGAADILGSLVPLVVGILIIILLVGAIIVLLPAFLVAILVWFVTGSFLYAGIAFLIVAIISLVVV